MKETLLNEFKGWKPLEVLWLFIAVATIIVLSIYWGDNPIGIISATTGVACVVCTGKGKLSAYVLGLINCVLYAYISYQQRYFGEVMLNLIYYVPMQFYGFKVWSQNMNETTHEVYKKQMPTKSRIVLFASVAAATAIYGLMLSFLGNTLPYVDSLSTVTSVVAMIISVKMHTEQWILWIIVDIVTVFMWSYAFFIQGSESIATLLMWSVYLLNAIFMYVKWHSESILRELEEI